MGLWHIMIIFVSVVSFFYCLWLDVHDGVLRMSLLFKVMLEWYFVSFFFSWSFFCNLCEMWIGNWNFGLQNFDSVNDLMQRDYKSESMCLYQFIEQDIFAKNVAFCIYHCIGGLTGLLLWILYHLHLLVWFC